MSEEIHALGVLVSNWELSSILLSTKAKMPLDGSYVKLIRNCDSKIKFDRWQVANYLAHGRAIEKTFSVSILGSGYCQAALIQFDSIKISSDMIVNLIFNPNTRQK